jgi:hypothetical protein
MGHVVAHDFNKIHIGEPGQQERSSLPVRTSEVYVLFTTLQGTFAALRIATALASALDVPLTLVHLRTVPYSDRVEGPAGTSPLETDGFVRLLKAQGLEVRVRIYLCRSARRAIPQAFGPHSLVLIGGRHRWWPGRSDRLQQALEAAGHFVVFVDEGQHAA